jgi:P-type Ca2+ transporter type 2C
MNVVEKYKGLTSAEVDESREKYGRNEVAPPERDPWWKMYLETFEDPIIRILLIAIGLSMFITGYKYWETNGKEFEWYEPVGVMVAVFLATYIGFINTWKAMKQFDVLNQINGDIPVTVVRNGNITQIPKSEVVVNDIVILETGMEVPADGEILESVSTQINESKLTGESVAVTKLSKENGGAKDNNKTAYPSWKTLSSTNVVSGYAIMRVTEVGEHTEIGKTTKEALTENEEASPLQKQLDKTAQTIGVIAFSVAGLLFVSLVIKGYINREIKADIYGNILIISAILGGFIAMTTVWMPIVYDFFELIGKKKEKPEWLESKSGLFKSIIAGIVIIGLGFLAVKLTGGNAIELIKEKEFLHSVEVMLNYFMIAVTLIVVAVPEGLPMATTIGLAYSMKKMLKENVLVKRMMACEAIGAVTVICTDKTGTLTMNEMRVKAKSFGAETDDFIYEAISINSTANLDRSVLPAKVVGNPTEGAFLLFMEENKVDYGQYRTDFKLESQLPFKTENKYMATSGISAISKKHVIHIKGAPERVIEFCNSEIEGGTGNGVYEIKTLDESRKKEIIEKITEYQNRGMRAIGFAYEEVADSSEGSLEKLSPKMSWLGYIIIEDPPRADVADAIETCRKAGIDVKIITGDNPLTAAEIGNQVKIETGKLEAEHLLTSTEYNELSGEKLVEKTLSLKVLARAKPQDKMTMVNILKENGHVVAMTGDGTNDAPAMNASDCGIAMGKTGTSTAKEAADLILMDDSFSSIVTGILWGRTIYLNIQRFILFQLTVNFTAILIAVSGPFIGIQLPLTVIQMLWVNLIMDTFAALALATEPPVKSIMEKKPRNPKEFIITKSISKHIVATGTLFVVVLLVMLFTYKNQGINLNISELKDGSEELEKATKALTIFFSTFVILQFWNMFNARAYGTNGSVISGLSKNKTFIMIAAAILIGQIIMVQFGGKIFRTVPLNVTEWAAIIGGTSLILVVREVVRLVRGK